MITYIKKDITTVERGIVLHGCNARGKQGSGVALAVRNKWPTEYTEYAKLCEEFKDNAMSLLGYLQLVEVGRGLFVGNAITQLNYGYDGGVYADIDAVKSSLTRAVLEAKERELPLYLPRIGCGLGGLSWEKQVGPILEQLNSKDVDIYVCDL